jgi:hypothetical protein
MNQRNFLYRAEAAEPSHDCDVPERDVIDRGDGSFLITDRFFRLWIQRVPTAMRSLRNPRYVLGVRPAVSGSSAISTPARGARKHR